MLTKFLTWLKEPFVESLNATKDFQQIMDEQGKLILPPELSVEKRKQIATNAITSLLTAKCLYCQKQLRKGSSDLYCKQCLKEHSEEIRKRKTYLFGS